MGVLVRVSPEADADLAAIWVFVAETGSIEAADHLIDAVTGRSCWPGTSAPAAFGTNWRKA